MEIGLREWLIIGGAVVVLLIVIDGWRRMRGTRNQLRMDIQKLPADVAEPVVDEINPELPNGGVRRLCDGLQGDNAPVTADAPMAGCIVTGTPVGSEPSAQSEMSVVPMIATVAAASVAPAAVLAADPELSERCEPTLDISGLALPDDGELPQSVTDAVEYIELADTQQPIEPRVTSSVVPETAVDLVSSVPSDGQAAIVVEEEIMTSAALFEAIEQSRQKRSAALASEMATEADPVPGDEGLTTANTGSETSVDTRCVDEVVVPRADPLLRPLPDADVNPIACVQSTESVKPIYFHDDDVSDDPLMRGVEAEDEALESITAEPAHGAETLSMPDEPNLRESAPSLVIVTPETEDAASVDEASFISDISEHSSIQETAGDHLMFNSAESHDTDIELDLPAEFTPQARPVQSVVSFSAARETAERTETVIAFPEKKRAPASVEVVEEVTVVVNPEQDVATAPGTDEAVGIENSASVIEPTSDPTDSRSEMMVQGGSLRQQPDPTNVLVMTVVANGPEGFDGKLLLQLVLACGMRFGEMDIFHRFEDGIDSGAVQFSMANATGTGVFDISTIETLNTRAVSFFMSMEEPREVMNALQCMLATAETVASHMKGELVDDNRLLMRPQTQEHYRQRVRDFEMRNLRRRSG